MSFRNDLLNQIKTYIDSPENIIDEVIKAKCTNPESLCEKQLADICSVRRNNLSLERQFIYSPEDLDLIISTVDSDPLSCFAKLKDAIQQIEFILEEK